MPLRPSSRCYRALTSPSGAPGEAVWVTDDVLSHAFQKYVHASKAQRRAVSSAPGPMYHRNRFGRRQMTELNAFQSATSLPAWALANAPDLMDWKWQPPKPELWSQRPPPSGPPSPTPTTPAPKTIVPTVEAPPIAAPAPPPPPEALRPQPSPPEIDSVELSAHSHLWQDLHNDLYDIRAHHRGSAEMHTDRFEIFLQRFVQTLSEGNITGTAAADVYVVAFKDLEFVARHHPEPARKLQIRLMSSLVEGVEAAQRANRAYIIPTSRFWDIYMLQVAKIEPNLLAANLLAFGLKNLRTRHDRRYHNILFNALDRFFYLWRGAEVSGEPEISNWPEISQTSQLAKMWLGRAAQLFPLIESLLAAGEMGEAKFHLDIVKRCLSRAQRFILKTASLMSDDSLITERLAAGLASNHLRMLYSQVTRLLGVPRVTWTRAHYNWLQVLARLPRLTTQQFRMNLDLFPAHGHAALSHTELCNLLLLHWTSHGKIELWKSTSDAWTGLQSKGDYTVLADLAFLVNKCTSPEECTAIFWEFWDILRFRGVGKAFLKQLYTLSTRQKLSSRFMERLAWTSNNHDVALMVHVILSNHQGKERNFWGPAFWRKYAARLNTRKNYAHGPKELVARLLGPDADLMPFKASHSTNLGMGFENQHRDNPRQSVNQDADLIPSKASHSTNPSMGFENQYRDNPRPWEIQDAGPMRPRPSRAQKQIEQVRRLKMGLVLLKKNRQITNRQAIHLATRFTVMLANTQGHLCAHDLATLTSLIMRTLDKGRCGSKKRFKWYLSIIHRFLGSLAHFQADLVLKRRRDANWALWRRRVALATTDLAQRHEAGPELQRPKELDDDQVLAPWWHSYMARNDKKRRTRLKIERPTRQRRGLLRQLCRSQMALVQKSINRAAETDAVAPPIAHEKTDFGLLTMQRQPASASVSAEPNTDPAPSKP